LSSYYFRNVGTDWATATNWSATDGGGATGAVPTAADDAFFSNNSGNCVINSGAKVCKTLDFTKGTGFTGTFTHNGTTLTVSGSVTLNAAMTIAGTGPLTINAAATLKANGVTWPNALNFAAVTMTIVLLGNWVNTGLVSQSSAAVTLNWTTNETLTCNGGLSVANFNLLGTAKVILGGGTWQSTSVGIVTNNLDLAGNITFGATIRYQTGTLKYVSGTIDATACTLFSCLAATTFDLGSNVVIPLFRTTGIDTLTSDLYVTTYETYGTGSSFAGAGALRSGATAWTITNFTVHITNVALTCTLPTDIIITGTTTLTTDSTTALTTNINGYSLNLKGNITTVGTGAIWQGTTTLTHTGTGTLTTDAWSLLSNPPCYIKTGITINTAGTVTFGANWVIGANTWTYTAGTIVTTNNNLWIVGSITLDVQVITWNKVHFIPLTSAGITVTLSGNLNADRFNFWYYKTTFAGAKDLTGNYLMMWGGQTGRCEASLVSGRTMTINTDIECFGTATFHPKISAVTPGSKAKLTFNGGNNQKVIYCDATDIDSSLGNKIWYLGGTISNSDNWGQSFSSIAPVAIGNIG